MEKHFLEDHVDGAQQFRAEPWYNPHGDCLVYRAADEAVVADRVDGILTIYRSAVDNRPIGFQIKGVMAIVARFGLDALTVESDVEGREVKGISIQALLLAAYEQFPRSVRRRKAYAEVMGPSSPSETLDAEELVRA